MAANQPTAFGELLRRYRQAAGLTQSALAEQAGLSFRGINDLERGVRRQPRRDTTVRLAEALGLADAERAAFFAAARPPAASAGPAPITAATGGALPSGTVTLLFTDIEGSTPLLMRQGSARFAALRAEHQALLRAAVAGHGGHEIDSQGDSFFVAFATAEDALRAAAAAQRALAAHPWPAEAAVRVRMGLHTGTPQLAGDRYVGLDVLGAARIAAAGHGGQVLLSETTGALVATMLPEGVSLRDLGPHRLKDLPQPERIFQLVLPKLPADFPPLKTLDLRPHNLPLQLTPLLGRQAELAAIAAQLRGDDARLVTLTGSGGIGKTRLAVQVAAELVEDFTDGVWFVRLSRLVDPALVVPTVAQTLGLKEQGDVPIAEMLRAHVADRRLLLVLDNFERVVGAAAEVAALLDVSAGLRVLVTSRVPLHLHGEREFALAPLPLPDRGQLPPPDRLTQYAAVALFVERAQAVRRDFAVTEANAPAIADICARLDGLPLAIVLAAARVKVLPPEALLARLARGIQLLSGGARDADERQQTMRATIAWSEDLLVPTERTLFRRLAVFVGRCTLEAAEAICAAPDGAEPLRIELLDGVTELVEQSLVQEREEGGEPRFGMLQVVREYALEQLETGGEAEALRRAHAVYFLALAEQAEPELTGPEAGAWLGRLAREHDNLRAALGWARHQQEIETGLRLAAALWRFWWVRGHMREGRAWIEGLLALADGPEGAAEPAVSEQARARALRASGSLAVWQGDLVAAGPRLEAAAALGRAAGDPHTAALALNSLGLLAKGQGDLERSAARFEESLALMRQAGDQRGSGVALGNLGDVTLRQGDLERAAAAFAEALALLRQVGDPAAVAVALVNLGWVARLRGEVDLAEARGREALALFRESGNPRQCAEALENLASTAGAGGRGERAARLLGAAAAVRETIGAPQPAPEQTDTEQSVAAVRAALGEEAWATAFTAGRALSLEEAIAEALESGHTPGPHVGVDHEDLRADGR